MWPPRVSLLLLSVAALRRVFCLSPCGYRTWPPDPAVELGVARSIPSRALASYPCSPARRYSNSDSGDCYSNSRPETRISRHYSNYRRTGAGDQAAKFFAAICDLRFPISNAALRVTILIYAPRANGSAQPRTPRFESRVRGPAFQLAPRDPHCAPLFQLPPNRGRLGAR